LSWSPVSVADGVPSQNAVASIRQLRAPHNVVK
jgi:hypothetical protein